MEENNKPRNEDDTNNNDYLLENLNIELQNVSAIKKTKFSVSRPSIEVIMRLDEEKNLDANERSTTFIDTTPDANYYRNILSVNGAFKSRPTLAQLQNHGGRKRSTIKKNNENNLNKNHDNIVKFGWIKGVLIRCILNIFGVMIFLRISWIVGQAGVGLASFIVLLASFVTFITALSTSAICTNGEVKGGGAYYLISRSLGPEFGGAIGIVYSFANAVAAAMYVIGFAETLVYLLKDNNIMLLNGGTNDVRIIGIITNLILLVIALVGMSWEAKVQIFLLIILFLALCNFIVGSFISGGERKQSRGFVGYSLKTLKDNFMPDWRDGEDFAHVFGVFFPAVTGILAGANISGNLKNPQSAIPKGTLLSILITTLVYLAFCWICGLTVVRDANGLILINVSNESNIANIRYDCTYGKDQKCEYGLSNSYNVMEMVSEIPSILKGNSPLIIAGIFSASLSSALASLVSAPKIFQAVAKDKIFPKIEYFAKGHGKDKEPWRGYFLTFIISSLFISIGELNVIAPIISNFFLMSYALVNYSCFDASISKTPGWRPAFKYYNKWVSLFGALLCLIVMFLIEWWAALLSFIVVAAFYIYVKASKPEINWGSSTQAHIYRRSLEYSLKLTNTEEHVKNFRPNFLVLSGEPNKRPALCDFMSEITKDISLMILANVKLDTQLTNPDNANSYKWMKKRRIKSFYTEINASSLRTGVVSLLQTTGLGKLRPNTLALGFKNNWSTENNQHESVLEYYQIINDAFQMNYGISILRIESGLDYTELLNDELSEYFLSNENNESSSSSSDDEEIKIKESFIDLNSAKTDNIKLSLEKMISKQNETNLQQTISDTQETITMLPLNELNNLTKRKNSLYSNNHVIKLKNSKINTGVLQGVNLFYKKNKSGFVDVYWLFDDGGLTILLAYLLMQRKHWCKCKLRIFIQTKSEETGISEEQRTMATLLSKFRIKFHELKVFSTLNKKPEPDSVLLHEKLIENWRLKANENEQDFSWKITENIYQQNIDKTNTHLVLRDLLIKHSQNSDLIIITISVPSKSTCAPLFLSWLDVISHQMPPVLMVRGNQIPVLTYYS